MAVLMLVSLMPAAFAASPEPAPHEHLWGTPKVSVTDAFNDMAKITIKQTCTVDGCGEVREAADVPAKSKTISEGNCVDQAYAEIEFAFSDEQAWARDIWQSQFGGRSYHDTDPNNHKGPVSNVSFGYDAENNKLIAYGHCDACNTDFSVSADFVPAKDGYAAPDCVSAGYAKGSADFGSAAWAADAWKAAGESVSLPANGIHSWSEPSPVGKPSASGSQAVELHCTAKGCDAKLSVPAVADDMVLPLKAGEYLSGRQIELKKHTVGETAAVSGLAVNGDGTASCTVEVQTDKIAELGNYYVVSKNPEVLTAVYKDGKWSINGDMTIKAEPLKSLKVKLQWNDGKRDHSGTEVQLTIPVQIDGANVYTANAVLNSKNGFAQEVKLPVNGTVGEIGHNLDGYTLSCDNSKAPLVITASSSYSEPMKVYWHSADETEFPEIEVEVSCNDSDKPEKCRLTSDNEDKDEAGLWLYDMGRNEFLPDGKRFDYTIDSVKTADGKELEGFEVEIDNEKKEVHLTRQMDIPVVLYGELPADAKVEVALYDGETCVRDYVEMTREAAVLVTAAEAAEAAEGEKAAPAARAEFTGVKALDKDNKPVNYSLRYRTENAPGIKLTQSGDANGFVLTASELDFIDIEVTKLWDDNENAKGLRPESVKLQLRRSIEGGEPETAAELTLKAPWTGSFKQQPVQDENGNTYTYEIVEEKVPYYEKAVVEGSADSGFTVTNTIEHLFDLTIKKVWKGNGSIPNAVKFELYANDQLVEDSLIKISARDNWTGVYKNLPVKDENGDKIVYAIKERAVRNYKSVVGPMNDDCEVVVTNIYTGRHPVTGDESNLGLWIGIAVVALAVAAAAAVVIVKKNKKSGDETDELNETEEVLSQEEQDGKDGQDEP